jgi:hypothetical protein
MDFSPSETFGFKDELFVSEWGTLAPINSPRTEDLDHGFRIIRVNVKNGTGELFMHNAKMGPASAQGSGGIERPVSCKFSPDGNALYVLDFGYCNIKEQAMYAFAHTGVLWKITKRAN